jgi:nickel-dependent lactate racemase
MVNHDATDTIHIGETSRGIPVEVNRRVVEADFRISTGFIEPISLPGFPAAEKVFSPEFPARNQSA